MCATVFPAFEAFNEALSELQGDVINNIDTALTALDSGKENLSNKVTSLSHASTDEQYPSAKAVYGALRHEPKLINTITLTDDTASTIEFTLDNNGIAFLLKNHITIYAEIPTASFSGYYFIMLNNQYSSIVYDSFSTAQKIFSKAEMMWNGKEWSAYTNVAAAVGVGSAAVRSPAGYSAITKDINKITVTTNNAEKCFPSGTVIEIYGENYA